MIQNNDFFVTFLMSTLKYSYRAGCNLRDPTKSGFARVSAFETPDPPENSENNNRRTTNWYKISDDSPFNIDLPPRSSSSIAKEKTISQPDSDSFNYLNTRNSSSTAKSQNLSKLFNTVIRTEYLCNKVTAKALSAQTGGELRPLFSKIAQQAMIKSRDSQKKVSNELKLSQMNEDAYWTDVEQYQGKRTSQISLNRANKIHQQQRLLSDDYKKQFELHDKIKAEEKQQLQNEINKIKQLQKEEEEKERQRQIEIKARNEQAKKEFQLLNEKLLQRKQKRIEEEIEQDKITMKQHEESEQRMQERQNLVNQRRAEKNRIRERLINDQAKKLAQLNSQRQKVQNDAESELAKRGDLERQMAIEKKRQMEIERNQDYNSYLRQKDYKKSEYDPDKEYQYDDTKDKEAQQAELMEAQRRKEQNKKLLREQMAQAAEKRERERRERIEDLRHGHLANQTYFLKNEDND